jgi:hypothetical protein
MDNVNKIKQVRTLHVNKISSSILTLPEWRIKNIYQEKIAYDVLRDAVHKWLMSFTQPTFKQLIFD